MTEPVTICEVGPRDGLQNEPGTIPTADKIALVARAVAAGLRQIEVTSFVSPRAVPQLADAAEVMAGVGRVPGVAITALVPNETGYARARAAGVDRVAVFASATEGFSRANINCSIDESFARFAPVFRAARADGIPVRGYVSCVTDCPYEGRVATAAVAAVAGRLLAEGAAEVSLGETLGRGTPDQVAAMLDAVLKVVPAARLAGHFHDTGGGALANVDVALARGLRVFDAALGGLGGCPYAPGAAGNLATEALVAHLHRLGHATGVDAGLLAGAARFARSLKRGAEA
ncbi:hydroxymethylglutaryl-CoA lyase [Rhodobacteraceae bacterium 2CG4]|uniref:Hydroxymethylglutaryl-CoA lyase n=1 Tax=Halovulum marinum TaxID=2662447 RepID=A0A6L5YVA1_9RHOB|nr:hydroxymethylglutaryl-CoA lyase [Halovulum marinum]MSU88336.1 hydroxymethylglutaryl-CoA lyase [Halovulum marinum]